MYLSLGNFQIDAFKYFRALHVGVQIFNDQTHDDERELALRRGDGTPQGDLGFFHAHVVGQVDEFLQVHAFLDGDVVNASGPGVLEVTVLNEIGTEAGRAAFKVDLIDQAVVHQRLQAVINGGQGDAGEFFAYPLVNFIGSWMIPLFQKNLIDFLPLLGKSQPGNDRQGRGGADGLLGICFGIHILFFMLCVDSGGGAIVLQEQFLLFIGARRRTEKGAVIPVDGRPCREIE